MAGQKDLDGFSSKVLFYLLCLVAILAYKAAEYSVEQILDTEEVWVYGTCYDYFDNLLHCNPGDTSPGKGLTIGSGNITYSSGCYGDCIPLDEPYAYQKAPFNIDTLAGFAAFLIVMGSPYIIQWIIKRNGPNDTRFF